MGGGFDGYILGTDGVLALKYTGMSLQIGVL
jgi:hypothetical protein